MPIINLSMHSSTWLYWDICKLYKESYHVHGASHGYLGRQQLWTVTVMTEIQFIFKRFILSDQNEHHNICSRGGREGRGGGH